MKDILEIAAYFGLGILFVYLTVTFFPFAAHYSETWWDRAGAYGCHNRGGEYTATQTKWGVEYNCRLND